MGTNALMNPTVSFSKFKRNPKDVLKTSMELSEAVYALSDNEPFAVILAPSVFKNFVLDYQRMQQLLKIKEQEIEILESLNNPDTKRFSNTTDFMNDILEGIDLPE
ncbi:MAG: type II toxin-antitoxin system Phd/YefM family antitoxin [Streptococcaceae bacterium]|nr:type II toxin-antitoxin system Phd/YefM family antitoxin [Streptococcaceae bacterium]